MEVGCGHQGMLSGYHFPGAFADISSQPPFSVNAVLPPLTIGRPFNPADGVYTTSTWLSELFKGDFNAPIIYFLSPGGWFVDVADAAVIHVAALLDSKTNGQRLWASGQSPVHINEILRIWREAFPNHTLPPDFDFPASPHQTIDREASTALLERYAGRQWTPLKDSLIANVAA